MKSSHQEPAQPNRQFTVFWACLLVFSALTANYGIRVVEILAQTRELIQNRTNLAATIGRVSDKLAQTDAIEARVQALSVDLIQVGATNQAAAQIVREFNIQWTPSPESSKTNAPTAK